MTVRQDDDPDVTPRPATGAFPLAPPPPVPMPCPAGQAANGGPVPPPPAPVAPAGWAPPQPPPPGTAPMPWRSAPPPGLPATPPRLTGPVPVAPPAGRRKDRTLLVSVLATATGLVVTAAVLLGVVLTRHASPRQGPAPVAWTAAQKTLLDRLDRQVLRACQPDAHPAGTGIDAALFCQTADGRQVAVYAYGDATAMHDDVTSRAEAVATTGHCEDGADEVFTWDDGPGSDVGGTVICQHRADREYLFFDDRDELVGFLAYGTDPAALFDWWERFRPFPDSGAKANTGGGLPTEGPRPA